MATKKINTRSERATIAQVRKEMSQPRKTESVRKAEEREAKVGAVHRAAFGGCS